MAGGIEISYCGPAPLPSELWMRWNFDPWLLAALSIAAVIWIFRAKVGSLGATQPDGRQQVYFWSGFVCLLVVFVSPLCALSAALFAGRIMHHVLLVAAAVPLLALAGVRMRGVPLVPAAILHAAIFWAWHEPGLYSLALADVGIYWLMQASLLGSALAFWSAALERRVSATTMAAVFLGFVVQMGLLAAIITFAPQPLYPPHYFTTGAFGLAALEDQQLAGVLMWTLGTAIYFGAIALFLLRRYREMRLVQIA